MLGRYMQQMRLRIVSPDIPHFIDTLIDNKVLLYDVNIEDELSATITASEYHYKQIFRLAELYQSQLEILQNPKTTSIKRFLKHRWLYLFGILLLICMTIFIPTRVYFFEISGNNQISDIEILETLSANGLMFGTKRTLINSETIKNSLLQQIPLLDWAGITTKGCLAVVEVREKGILSRENDTNHIISSIVAERDGYIESITVTKGYPQCKPGQSVLKGQVLISGYEDCGLLIRGTQAAGEIKAKTYRTNTMIVPTIVEVRTKSKESFSVFAIQIGKKLINLNKCSRISPGTCVRIQERKYLTLPGGFQLPISFIREKIVSYEIETVSLEDKDLSWIDDSLEHYVTAQMYDGKILQRTALRNMQEECCTLIVGYACLEQIGKTKIEEILSFHGKNN